MKDSVQIVCPSLGRWDNLQTPYKVANVATVVRKDQIELYREHNPDLEFIPLPDDVVGLPATRQWIIEKFDTVFMLDDDMMYCRYLGNYTGGKSVIFTPDDVYRIIQQCYIAASDMDAALFGFSLSADYRFYDGIRTHKYSGFILGQNLGVFEAKRHGLYFDTRYYTNDDYWITLLNAYKNRYCYKDLRFGFIYKKTGYLEGGNAKFRNWETEKSDFELLLQHFGDKVVKPKQGNTAMRSKPGNMLLSKEEIENGYGLKDNGKRIGGNKENRHHFEKRLQIPF